MTTPNFGWDPNSGLGGMAQQSAAGVAGQKGAATPKISYKRFKEWLDVNLPAISDQALTKFWSNYQQTGQIPFTSMQAAQGQLEQLTANDTNAFYQGHSPSGSTPKTTDAFGTGVSSAADRNERQTRIDNNNANPGAGAGTPVDNTVPGLDFPGPWADVTLPDLTPGDFTNVANQRAASIYAPQYAALDQMLNQANTQYQRNDPAMEGLYNTLFNDIGTNKADVQNRYAGATANTATQGQNLQQNLGDIYSAEATPTMNIANNLGLGDAGQQNQQYAENQKNFSQGQAAQTTQQEQDYLSSTGNNYADWLTGTGTSVQAEGTEQRANLIAQLANIAAGINQQRLGVGSEQSKYASELAQQLQSSDLDQRTQLWNMGYEINKDQDAAAQQDYENRYGAYSDQVNWDMEQAKVDAANAAAAASASGAGGSGSGKPASVPEIMNTAITAGYAPDVASRATDTLMNLINGGQYHDYQTFANALATSADRNGDTASKGAYTTILMAAIQAGLLDFGPVATSDVLPPQSG